MRLAERLNALVALGQILETSTDELKSVMEQTYYRNAWFTLENQERALTEIRQQFLDSARLEAWTNAYSFPSGDSAKKVVGLVLAGNIPLVGFHDILCVFVAGHKAKIKLSEKDPFLLPYLIKQLIACDARTADYIELTDGYLKGIDAVIATGSNNSARYFEAYFGRYPHIIRKNRNAVAILSTGLLSGAGSGEDADDLHLLGKDVFSYFGLGCRNVSKIYVPRGYDFLPLLEALHEFRDFIRHDKYKNNFDYQFALLILNKVEHKANGCILLREAAEIASPIAVLFYEFYDDRAALENKLRAQADDIQLVVAKEKVEGLPTFDFGQAQKPALTDYADGIDTLAFLLSLSS
jgi:hypothetical protein